MFKEKQIGRIQVINQFVKLTAADGVKLLLYSY